MFKSLFDVQFLMINSDDQEVIDILMRYKSIGYEYTDINNVNKMKVQLSNLPDNIDELNLYCHNCNLCNLSKVNNERIFSIGSKTNDVWIVGLTTTIHSANEMMVIKNLLKNHISLNIENIYFTSIVKCETIKEVDKKDINICIDYLYKQIIILKPKIIITLGESFGMIMKRNYNLQDKIGTIFDFNGSKIIPFFDPKFLIKNPSFLNSSKSIIDKIDIASE
ncbi:MAG: uracil-DNA glycosylase family protein [Campylobacterota bacterium]|nr:uracil-DNA glycosylase family protein [Campylobacterota bacterium]